MKRAAGWILFNLIAVLMVLGVVEAFFFVLIRNPAWLSGFPGFIQNAAYLLYMAGDARIIQFLPECARYDPGLGYTLKPGTCAFSNREFTVDVHVNSLGVRDREQSLTGPEVIVSGDSVAMGWGVGQEEAFARVLEKKTGKKVLNASISSFGTAREMMLLRRLDTNRLKYCIIQYADNDFEENLDYFHKDNVLSVMTEDAYKKFVSDHAAGRNYFFGKYVFKYLPGILAGMLRSQKGGKRPDPQDAAKKFINCLWSARMRLQDARIIVCELNGCDYFSPFILALEKEKDRPDYPAFIRDMIVVDFSNLLKRRHFFALDGHPNREGHALVAEELARVIADEKNRKPDTRSRQ